MVVNCNNLYIYEFSNKSITIMNFALNLFCKVEFIQSFCWLYSVLNLLVIQHLENLYLGGNHVRVVCEKV